MKYFDDDLELLPPQIAHARVAARDMKASWLMSPYDLSRLANTPGYPVTYDSAKESPFEFSERTDRVGGPQVLAVTFAAANTLWGWGRVALHEVTDTETALVEASVELTSADVISPQTLVRYREQFKTQPHQKKPKWTEKQRVFLPDAARLHGGAAELARALGVSYEAVRTQLRRAEEEAQERVSAVAFTAGLGSRNKAA